jgi:hypothetical protein
MGINFLPITKFFLEFEKKKRINGYVYLVVYQVPIMAVNIST